MKGKLFITAAALVLGLGCGIIGYVTNEHPGVIRVTE